MIDLILTNNKEAIDNINYLPPIGKSHHAIVTAHVNFKKEEKKNCEKIKKYQVHKGDYAAINSNLSKIDWDKTLKAENKDVNSVWSIISNKIIEQRDQHIPCIFINSHKTAKKPAAINDSILHLIREKRWYYKRYKKYSNMTNYHLYCLARAKVNSYLRKEKRQKEINIAKNMKDNPKRFYQYIASKTTKKDSIPDLTKQDGTKTQSDKEKSEELNTFFNSVFTNEDNDNIPEFQSKISDDKNIEEINITEIDMKNILIKLKSDKSPGTDEIHPKLLRECAENLARPLKILFDITMRHGKIPNEWKKAEIRPIYKRKGKKTEASNYRPVSLTSVIGKVFEKIVKNKLCNHLTENKLLSKHQFGFIPGRSTNTQLLITIKEWLKNVDKGLPTDVAYMDFKKAFDAVPHERLLYKLKQYGISGRILLWIRDFLSDRTQYVKINNTKSVELPVTSGVPQGSVLGPMLFIYFINDLPEVCTVLTKIYADDTKAYTTIQEDRDRARLQETIDNMYEWTQNWQLNFNETKCKILHIGENNPNYQYFIGKELARKELESTKLEKDLGVLVDPNLKFESHIEHIIKRASSKKAIILRNFTYRSKKVLVPLFKTLIRPILEYNNTVWDSSYRIHIDLIESVQRKFTKHILEVKKLTYEQRLKSLNLPTLEYRRFRGDLIEIYKIAHGLYDRESVNDLIQFNSNSRLRGHNYKIIKQTTNKRQFQHFFSNRIVNHWNKLPEDVVNTKSINAFKNKIDIVYSNLMYKTNLIKY